MRNVFLTLVIAGSLFAANTLNVSSVTEGADGAVDITLGYSFDVDVAGFQFDLLSDGQFTLTGAEGGASGDAGFMVSTNESGRVIGFSLTGGVIAAGSGDFLVVSGTTEAAAGTVITLSALEDCASDGDDACDGDDTRMVLSDTDANALESSFISSAWTVGDNTLNNEQPLEYALSANYPNPFNPVTNIRFSLPEDQFVKMNIFNMKGQLVNTLVNEKRPAGVHTIHWNAGNAASGVYLYQLQVGNRSITQKMVLMK